jgi:hypothetical protein
MCVMARGQNTTELLDSKGALHPEKFDQRDVCPCRAFETLMQLTYLVTSEYIVTKLFR